MSILEQEQAQAALQHSSTLALRRLKVELRDGKFCIFGQVSSFYQKQLAQESLRPLGHKIENLVEVAPSESVTESD